MALADFPDETFLQIFSYLTHPRDLLRAAAVCRVWRRLGGDHSLWMRGFGDVCLPVAQALALMELRPEIRVGMSIRESTEMYDYLLVRSPGWLDRRKAMVRGSLTRLTIRRGTSTEAVLALLESLKDSPNLQHISVTLGYDGSAWPVINTCGKYFSNTLVSLETENDVCTTLLQRLARLCPNIRAVTMNFSTLTSYPRDDAQDTRDDSLPMPYESLTITRGVLPSLFSVATRMPGLQRLNLRAPIPERTLLKEEICQRLTHVELMFGALEAPFGLAGYRFPQLRSCCLHNVKQDLLACALDFALAQPLLCDLTIEHDVVVWTTEPLEKPVLGSIGELHARLNQCPAPGVAPHPLARLTVVVKYFDAQRGPDYDLRNLCVVFEGLFGAASQPLLAASPTASLDGVSAAGSNSGIVFANGCENWFDYLSHRFGPESLPNADGTATTATVPASAAATVSPPASAPGAPTSTHAGKWRGWDVSLQFTGESEEGGEVAAPKTEFATAMAFARGLAGLEVRLLRRPGAREC